MLELTRQLEKGTTFPVVAVGTSAGGIKALQLFFEAMPANIDAAFVVVLHLDPEHQSDLASILASRTALSVTQVQGPTPIEPNHVYVIPPNRQLIVADGTLNICEFDEPRGKRAPIDHFFRSLAIKLGDGFAVILTGAGSDGAVGVKAIKENGGLILVQDPNDAEYSSMPQSAIATGCADIVLPLRDLVNELIKLIRTKEHIYAVKLRDAEEDLLRAIFSQLRARTGHDFSQYKRATVLRRMGRRMHVRQIGELKDYLELIRNNPEEIQTLFGDLLISVTTFFRDPAAYDALQSHVIHNLFEGKDVTDVIRVWVPGCATGEEAYSIAMLLLEEAASRSLRPEIQVFASDIDSNALAVAREGRYPTAIQADVSEERLRRFFVLERDRYRVKRELRDKVLFAVHNLNKDPPFSRLDLVSCRNVLIYFDRELQRQACGIFNYALRSGGFLFLGASENAETPPGAFRVIDRDARIYQSRGRKGTAILPTQHGFESTRVQAPQISVPQTRAAVPGDATLHRHMLEEAAPPSVLLDSSHRILHLSESAGRFLQLPGGPPTPDIGELIRPELRLDLLSALSRAFERQLSTLTVPVRVTFNGTSSQVQLQVKPIFKENTQPAALVFFIEANAVDFPGAEFPSFGFADAASNGARHALSEELESSKAQLRTSRQDYEAAIEELRAANEELQSVGEEYRSTAEELETSREELQSINEELQAVNHELKLKLETISRAHSDLQNLISATDVGTLFLDSNLRIRRFTPRVADLFNITMSDEGRPISDFTHRLLNYRGLDHDARGVLTDLSAIESEVQSDSGRWYLARMRPYRTVEDRIEGVVVTFVDITERRAEQRALRESETRLQLAREATSLGIFDYNADAGVVWFDKRCRELWGVGETGEVNLDVFLAGVAESHRADAEEALHRAFDQHSDGVFSLEFQSSGPGKEQWLSAIGKVFFTGDGASHDAARLVGSIQDVSATKAWESRQKLLLRELSHRVKNTLAVVNAMARQTLRDDTRPEALEKYEARILALSDAHDLLVQSEWQGAEVGALVNRLLAAYSDSNRGRIAITGPELLLPAYLAAPFAMLLHELAANAAKYGALGERGTVGITWRVLLQRDERLLEFVWKESGGPPVFADSPAGFGTFFIENGFPDAKVERQLDAGSLTYRIELPV